jgi:large subunit ribosomal protein L31
VQQQLSYRPVVFLDRSADFGFVVRSTALTDKSIVWEDGQTYPLVTLEVSSASHPFYTGQQTTLDSAGRIDRFNRRFRRGTGRAGASLAPVGTAPDTRALGTAAPERQA